MRQKLRRLREEKDTRRLIAVILGGKMLGIVGVLGAMKIFAWLFESAAWAQGAAPITHAANDFVSPINTVWVLVTAFLVFFMQAGFMGLEAGFARSRETVNVLLECVFDTCLCGILYWAFGFAFQFGAGNAFIGHTYFFLHGAPLVYNYGGVTGGLSYNTGVSFLAFFLFQFAFADTAST